MGFKDKIMFYCFRKLKCQLAYSKKIASKIFKIEKNEGFKIIKFVGQVDRHKLHGPQAKKQSINSFRKKIIAC